MDIHSNNYKKKMHAAFQLLIARIITQICKSCLAVLKYD